MTLPGRGTRQHNTDEAPRANPCARGIDRNSRKRRRMRMRRSRRRPRRPVARQAWPRASPQGAGRRIGIQPRRQAGVSSAVQRRYVPSQNAWAYFTIVEQPAQWKSWRIEAIASVALAAPAWWAQIGTCDNYRREFCLGFPLEPKKPQFAFAIPPVREDPGPFDLSWLSICVHI